MTTRTELPLGGLQDATETREFLECMADSPMSTWCWPDCSRPRVLSIGMSLRALGYAEGEPAGQLEAYLGLVHPEDRPGALAIVREIIEEQRTGNFEAELRLRTARGEYCRIRVIGSVVRRAGSQTLSAFGVTRLIEAAEETPNSALQLSEDALGTVLDEIGYPVVLMRLDGTVLQHNEATVRVIGRPLAAGAGGYRYCPFLHREDGTAVVGDFTDSVVRSGQRDEREIWRFERWWRIHLVPLRDAAQEVKRLLLLAEDISPLKAEQKAELAREKALTRTLVREVHHRIKNHLQGLVGLLRLHGESSQAAREVLDDAVAQIQSIAAVHGILAKEGDTSIDFASLFQQIVDVLRVGAPVPLECVIEPSCSQPLLVSQEESVPLAIAVGELLTNALKHTFPGSRSGVVGRLVCGEGFVELSITNAPARLPEAFGPTSYAQPNTGLALVMALLPRDRSSLEIAQEGEAVKTRLRLVLGDRERT